MKRGQEGNLRELEKRIGYRFRDRSLLRRSLVHASYQQDHPGEKEHNQRLEFLGDSVLHLILAERLFHDFPAEREGILTQRRAMLAKGHFLALLAEELGLGDHLLMSRAELDSGGRSRPSALEDALEAVVGAIYLDSTYARTRKVVLRWYGDVGERLARLQPASNPKGRFQELVQPRYGNDAISYKVSRMEGEAHDRWFEVALSLNGKVIARGSGASKKKAEEKAAEKALEQWQATP